jgi:hypothetical protein
MSIPSTKLSDLGILDQLIKRNTEKFGDELNSVIFNFEQNHQSAVLPSEEKEEGVSLEPSSVPPPGGGLLLRKQLSFR